MGIITRWRSFAKYWKYFVARFNDVHAFGYNFAGSERIWMKFGELRVYCLELALTDFARSVQKPERETLRKFVFLSGKQRTTLPISGQPYFMKFAHKTWFCDVMNPFRIIFWKLALKGSFSKKNVIIVNEPRFLWNDYKSWKMMTGWRAYGMLAFHPYRWNQLKVIPLDSRVRTQNDFHRRIVAERPCS